MNASATRHPRLREVGLALLALLLIGGALALTFSHVFGASPDTVSGRYDIYRYYGPITFFLDYNVSQGELPLWNPLVYCGLPNAANPQAFVFYPPNLVRSVLLPDVTPLWTLKSMIALIGLHLLLMGLGSYLLGRAHRLSFPAALTAALVWVCSALIVRRACEFHFLYTIAWLPFILLAVKAALDTPHIRARFAYCVGAGLLLGMAILGGFLQIVSYACAAIALYALLYRVLAPRASAEEGVGAVKGLSRDVVAFAAIFAVAGLLAAVLLLPVAELAGFSARQKGMPVPMYSDMLSWDVTRLYQSLVIFPGTKYEAETLRGAGIVAILLCVAGLFHRNRRLVLLFALLGYALVDCGFGPPFPLASLMHVFTPFSPSAYSRGFDFALLPFGMLAGLGVDSLWRDRARQPARALLSLLLVYAAAATIGPMAYWSFPRQDYLVGVDYSVVIIPAVAALAMLGVLWMPRRRQATAFALVLFPALLFAETWEWNRHYVPWMIAKHFTDTTPVRQDGHAFPTTNTRETDPIANRDLYSLTPVYNGVDPLHFADVRNLLSGTPRDKQARRLVTDWEPTAENHRGNLLLKRFFWLSRYAINGALPGKQEPFPVTTTTYVTETTDTGIPAPPPQSGLYKSVSPDAVRVEIPNAATALENQRRHNGRGVTLSLSIPETVGETRAGSSGAIHSVLIVRYTSAISAQVDTRFRVAGSNVRTWGKRHRVRPTRNAAQELEIPLPDSQEMTAEVTIIAKGSGAFTLEDAFLMVDPADEDALLSIAEFGANSVTLDIGPLPGPRVLTFLDAWYPGWHVYVDDVEAPLLKADDVFKAVVVPEGQHRVRFAFRPRTVTFGFAISLAGFVLALGGLAWLIWPRRGARISVHEDPDV